MGKSAALLADPLRYAHYRDFRGILFRRTNDELRELIWKSRIWYPQAFPGAKFSEQSKTWTFPSGATIWAAYCDRDEDVLRYQGQSFCWIGWDEAGQYPTPFPFDYMRSRLRTTNPEIPLAVRLTTNPGGPGHAWIKDRFINPAPWGQRFPATDPETGKVMTFPEGHPKAGKPLFYRRFIPAKLTDNPYLMQDDSYMANLLSLPETQRNQLLYGDWNTSDGAMFSEFKRSVHVIAPFDIPSSWIRFRAADWGYTQPAVCLWFAVSPDNKLYVYRELVTKKVIAEEFAQKVLEMEEGERIRYGVMDASAWQMRGQTGPSIAEAMIRAGCTWRQSDRSPKSRVHGAAEIHRRLRIDPATGEPGIYFFNNCVDIIANLPILPIDKSNPEDIDTTANDHSYDALRYGCMSRPLYVETPFDNRNPSYAQQYTPADNSFGY